MLILLTNTFLTISSKKKNVMRVQLERHTKFFVLLPLPWEVIVPLLEPAVVKHHSTCRLSSTGKLVTGSCRWDGPSGALLQPLFRSGPIFKDRSDCSGPFPEVPQPLWWQCSGPHIRLQIAIIWQWCWKNQFYPLSVLVFLQLSIALFLRYELLRVGKYP